MTIKYIGGGGKSYEICGSYDEYYAKTIDFPCFFKVICLLVFKPDDITYRSIFLAFFARFSLLSRPTMHVWERGVYKEAGRAYDGRTNIVYTCKPRHKAKSPPTVDYPLLTKQRGSTLV